MFLGWGFRVTHQHHIASFSYLADIILTISTTPTLTEACTMYIVQTQFYTIMGFRGTHHHHQPTLIDSIGRVVVMFLVSYSYHTDKIIQTYTQTRPHTSTWGHTIEKHQHSEQHTETQRHAHTKYRQASRHTNTDKHWWTEMEFVTHVTHGGSVKFLPAV